MIHGAVREKRPTRRTSRRGYTLVLFAMLLFGLMAMAALVIDIGFARLTQRQLQGAAESGALEGLRGEGAVSYSDRRAASRELIQWHFDDDLNSGGSYPTGDDGAFDTGSGQFGAGPKIEFSGGAGESSLHASELLEVDPNQPVDRPMLVDGPPSPAGSFRVELRRGALDASTADLHATSPDGVPYLFARGSLIHRQLVDGGIVVRGAGNAIARRALSIGFADPNAHPVRRGLIPWALQRTYWNDYWNGPSAGTPDLQTVVDGEIAGVGRFFSVAGAEAMPLTVGREIPAPSTALDGSYAGYVPIYEVLSGPGPLRVVGFGEALIEVSGGGTTATMTPRASRVAAENASATRCFPVSLTAAQAAELAAFLQTVKNPLQAASLQ